MTGVKEQLASNTARTSNTAGSFLLTHLSAIDNLDASNKMVIFLKVDDYLLNLRARMANANQHSKTVCAVNSFVNLMPLFPAISVVMDFEIFATNNIDFKDLLFDKDESKEGYQS